MITDKIKYTSPFPFSVRLHLKQLTKETMMSYLNYYGCTTEGLTIKVIAFSSAKHRDHWVGRALLERESLTGAEVRRLFNSEKHYTSVN